MIVFSDLHLRDETEEVCIGEVLPGIAQEALDRKEKDVAFLGDFWHVRYSVPVRLFNAVRDELRRWTSSIGLEVRLLPGNHDQINYEGRNALEAYGDIPGVTVFTDPQWDEYGLWIPYRKNNEEIEKALTLKKPKDSPRILWTHHGVKGALMNDFHQNTEGLEPSAFDKFTHVFSGHYHKRQELKHVTYIGSPWQTKADEAGQPKGFATWNGSALEFVDTHWGKRFHKFELGPDETLDLSQVGERDEVRVVTAPGINHEVVSAQLAAAGVAHIVTPQEQHNEARLQVAANAGLEEYAKAYVEQFDTEIQKEQLLEAFGEIAA
jgi:DNA repair exonuclease SbcCD nuclease subunit